MRRRAASRCRPAIRCPTTGWCSRPASNCASMRSPVTAKPPRQQAPHAWTTDAAQFELLRRQITAMADDGVVAIVAPANPSRCPPGPYERASMIAHYLKTNKPSAKIVILDAKDTFTMQPVVSRCVAEALSRHDRVEVAVERRQCRLHRRGEKIDRDRFRHLRIRRRQRDPAAEGRQDRGAGRRRRPHRLVPGRCGDVRIAETKEHPRHRRLGLRRHHAEVGVLRRDRRQALRRSDRAPLRRRHAGRRADVEQLLQRRRARLRHFDHRRIPSGERRVHRSRQLDPLQPARCAADAARRGRQETPMPGSTPRRQRFSVEEFFGGSLP